MWRALRHPNVLPMLGVTATEPPFAMVSEWMTNGDINDFVKTHPEADRLKLVGPSPKFCYPRLSYRPPNFCS